MEINVTNKELYASAFIADGSYEVFGHWTPSIDESDIECHTRLDDGSLIPATPLGYRDYLTSRIEGIRNILAKDPDTTMSLDELKGCVKGQEPFKIYDHLYVPDKDGHFVIVGYMESGSSDLFIVDQNNQMLFVTLKCESDGAE